MSDLKTVSPEWQARTTSGTIYRKVDGSIVLFDGEDGGWKASYHNAGIGTFFLEDYEGLGSVTNVSPDTIPEVGKHIYTSTIREWRLSTEVVEVIVFD